MGLSFYNPYGLAHFLENSEKNLKRKEVNSKAKYNIKVPHDMTLCSPGWYAKKHEEKRNVWCKLMQLMRD